ncbi:MAG TPA: LamG domain-containing protein [Sphingopyxis sp.]|uniref:LamG domain-containing protein n=1 Tax=Sphingopyxis sp. TaxID=1908224 RepID=UPI002CF0072F|nr:LamG domain-containing protein [Sphingopyxis sp.]HWW56368.1 LamG domain-containing protein [Sphingopyxis sp.]
MRKLGLGLGIKWGRPPPPDKVFTKLLMGFDSGVDASQVFVDESPVARSGVTIAGGSSAAIATAQKKFGPSALSLPTVDDWVQWPDSDDWFFGTGPFTVELWHRPDAITGVRQLIGQNQDLNAGAVNASWALYEFNGVIQFAFHDAGLNDWRTVSGGSASVLSTWVHTLVDRDLDGKIRVYRDGVMVGSYAYTGALRQVATALAIGAAADGSADYLGYMDEIRIMKGRAACASDAGFTPPAAAYPR